MKNESEGRRGQVGRQWTANPPFTSSNLVAASTFFRSFLLVLSICLVIAGYLLGDPLAIAAKAVNICLECIGIG